MSQVMIKRYIHTYSLLYFPIGIPSGDWTSRRQTDLHALDLWTSYICNLPYDNTKMPV